MRGCSLHYSRFEHERTAEVGSDGDGANDRIWVSPLIDRAMLPKKAYAVGQSRVSSPRQSPVEAIDIAKPGFAPVGLDHVNDERNALLD